MKKLLMIISLVFLLCFTFGCQAYEEKPAVDVEADIEAIKAWYKHEVAAINTGDIEAYIANYTEDIVWLPPNEPICQGIEAIRQWMQLPIDQLNMKYILVPKEIEVRKDLAFVMGTYEMEATPKIGGEMIEEVGKFIHIFKRQPDGSWKGWRCTWNTDSPPPSKED